MVAILKSPQEEVGEEEVYRGHEYIIVEEEALVYTQCDSCGSRVIVGPSVDRPLCVYCIAKEEDRERYQPRMSADGTPIIPLI